MLNAFFNLFSKPYIIFVIFFSGLILYFFLYPTIPKEKFPKERNIAKKVGLIYVAISVMMIIMAFFI